MYNFTPRNFSPGGKGGGVWLRGGAGVVGGMGVLRKERERGVDVELCRAKLKMKDLAFLFV